MVKNVTLYSSMVWICGCGSVIGVGGYQTVDGTTDSDSEVAIDVGDTTSDLDAEAASDSARSDAAKDSTDTRDVGGACTFGQLTTYNTGFNGGPNFIALADTAHDSTLNLLEVNSFNYLGQYFNAGAGIFSAETSYATYPGIDAGTGDNTVWITTGDFNHDGYLDVAVANGTSNSVGVFINNKSSGFQPQVTYGVGQWPAAIATADFNGDGILDLVVANSNDGTIGLLLGIAGDTGVGTGTFGAQTTFSTTASGVTALVVADFGGDAKPDVAFLAPYPPQLVGVMLNTAGVLNSPITYGFAGIPNSIAVGDFNADGKYDLFITHEGPHESDTGMGLNLLLNQGSGVFTYQATTLTYSPGAVAAADFNHDGLPDVAFLTSIPSLEVWINTGADVDAGADAAGFPFAAPLTFSTGPNPAETIAVGDLNGDGHPDIVIGSNKGEYVGTIMANCQ